MASDKQLESKFQRKLKQDLKKRFPGCFVLKLPSDILQGIPDLLILYKKYWAMLECKRSANAPHRPNQDYWVKRFNEMSFAKFIYPENKKEVLDELQQSFRD